ncbi:hypothetical protein BJ508DRAFT_18462 [Ascobolus immersus RN42]|uniref:Uncharacterized protein n=1 Tax=Ascobolus immersus RN42 TaxID=1160509 RepID=A0A3N4HP23_ASCIM|nr:hypothetical protein BJ508DRAFT_18462 [Ascobolus immersus RN42]
MPESATLSYPFHDVYTEAFKESILDYVDQKILRFRSPKHKRFASILSTTKYESCGFEHTHLLLSFGKENQASGRKVAEVKESKSKSIEGASTEGQPADADTPKTDSTKTYSHYTYLFVFIFPYRANYNSTTAQRKWLRENHALASLWPEAVDKFDDPRYIALCPVGLGNPKTGKNSGRARMVLGDPARNNDRHATSIAFCSIFQVGPSGCDTMGNVRPIWYNQDFVPPEGPGNPEFFQNHWAQGETLQDRVDFFDRIACLLAAYQGRLLYLFTDVAEPKTGNARKARFSGPSIIDKARVPGSAAETTLLKWFKARLTKLHRKVNGQLEREKEDSAKQRGPSPVPTLASSDDGAESERSVDRTEPTDSSEFERLDGSETLRLHTTMEPYERLDINFIAELEDSAGDLDERRQQTQENPMVHFPQEILRDDAPRIMANINAKETLDKKGRWIETLFKVVKHLELHDQASLPKVANGDLQLIYVPQPRGAWDSNVQRSLLYDLKKNILIGVGDWSHDSSIVPEWRVIFPPAFSWGPEIDKHDATGIDPEQLNAAKLRPSYQYYIKKAFEENALRPESYQVYTQKWPGEKGDLGVDDLVLMIQMDLDLLILVLEKLDFSDICGASGDKYVQSWLERVLHFFKSGIKNGLGSFDPPERLDLCKFYLIKREIKELP